MLLISILDSARIRCNTQAASKKRVLETLSELLVEGIGNPVTPHAVFDCLVSRERLGSTALGFGVALPHGRMAKIAEPVGAFLTVGQGVDFDSPDGGRVDLVFGLLVPEDSTEEHLQILGELATLFDQADLRDKLRASASVTTAFELLTT
jgi:PTS system nitrogen regulatory IIA component